MPFSSSVPAYGLSMKMTRSSAGSSDEGLSPAVAAYRALVQRKNRIAAKHYGIAMGCFILLFSIFHWTRYLYSRHASQKVKDSSVMRLKVSTTRLARQIVNQPVPGFNSIGHLLVVLIFIVINISVTVTNIDYSTIIGFGARCGWMAMCNLAFITFLALKNTPLAFLTSYSYESLNPLHQIAGYITCIYALIHVTIECVYFSRAHFLELEIKLLSQVHGLIAFSSFFIIFVTALTMKKLRYEAFYIIHIVCYMLVIINLCLHQPEFIGTVIIVSTAGALWGSDRILRGLRILWNTHRNNATIYPLPHGGTRVVVTRSPHRATPGTHCFLWIPKIRLVETHPFTIVSTSPNLELVISAHDGFTRALHNYAVRNPGATLRASVDGPYGALPNFTKIADKMVLIAGGSGATFTFGIALDILKRLPSASKTTIDFIWTVREQEAISWFSKELEQLQASHRVNLIIHTTRPSPPPTINTTPSSTQLDEKSTVSPNTTTTSISDSTTAPSTTTLNQTFSPENTDLEKRSVHEISRDNWDMSTLDIQHGRPDVAKLIAEVVAQADPSERIVIGACGPSQMMTTVRKAATKAITVKGPSVGLHTEQFGW